MMRFFQHHLEIQFLPSPIAECLCTQSLLHLFRVKSFVPDVPTQVCAAPLAAFFLSLICSRPLDKTFSIGSGKRLFSVKSSISNHISPWDPILRSLSFSLDSRTFSHLLFFLCYRPASLNLFLLPALQRRF